MSKEGTKGVLSRPLGSLKEVLSVSKGCLKKVFKVVSKRV